MSATSPAAACPQPKAMAAPRLWLALGALFICAQLAACATEPAPPTAQVELGGADNSGKIWLSLDELDHRPPIIFGPQGGYHIWFSLRAHDLDPVALQVAVDMTVVGSGRRVKPGRAARAVQLRQEGQWLVFSGLYGYVSCPCQIRDQEVRVTLAATDRRGRQASASATITPRWSNPCNVAQRNTCVDICTLPALASCLEQ